MELNIKPIYNYVDIKPFTEKDVYLINKIVLNNPNLLKIYDKFYYGYTQFGTSKHDNWNISFEEKYNNNINTIIIKLKQDIIENPQNNKYLIIFQNITKSINSYGYFWVNNNDNMDSMHLSIEYLIDYLLYAVNRDMNIWPKVKLYNAIFGIPRKYNSVELEDIYKEYIETYRCKQYAKWKNLKQYNNRFNL